MKPCDVWTLIHVAGFCLEIGPAAVLIFTVCCWFRGQQQRFERGEILSPAVPPISQRRLGYIKSLNPGLRAQPVDAGLLQGQAGRTGGPTNDPTKIFWDWVLNNFSCVLRCRLCLKIWYLSRFFSFSLRQPTNTEQLPVSSRVRPIKKKNMLNCVSDKSCVSVFCSWAPIKWGQECESSQPRVNKMLPSFQI